MAKAKNKRGGKTPVPPPTTKDEMRPGNMKPKTPRGVKKPSAR